MKAHAKLIGGLAIVGAILFLLMRPRQQPHPRIPPEILYSHYRVVSKTGHENIACGTGVAINSRQLLTAAHVIEEGDNYELDLFTEDGEDLKTIPLHLVATGKKMGLDLALLETDEDLPFYLESGLDDFKVGSWGYIIGCAYGTCPYNVYFGVFASKRGPYRLPMMSQIAVTTPPGESGGGVYSVDSGKLVGICYGSREGFSLFTPAKLVKQFLDSIQR